MRVAQQAIVERQALKAQVMRSPFPPPLSSRQPEDEHGLSLRPKPVGQKAMFWVGDRHYTCILEPKTEGQELRIRNDRGHVLAVQQGQTVGLLGPNRTEARTVDVREPHFRKLIESALSALAALEAAPAQVVP